MPHVMRLKHSTAKIRWYTWLENMYLLMLCVKQSWVKYGDQGSGWPIQSGVMLRHPLRLEYKNKVQIKKNIAPLYYEQWENLCPVNESSVSDVVSPFPLAASLLNGGPQCAPVIFSKPQITLLLQVWGCLRCFPRAVCGHSRGKMDDNSFGSGAV